MKITKILFIAITLVFLGNVSFAAIPITTAENEVVLQETPSSFDQVEEGTSGKSQLVALLVCIFVGGIGIHRFYLGYIGIGIIQLLTLGGFGIWTLIDLIMIITGDLKPKDGEYEDTF